MNSNNLLTTIFILFIILTSVSNAQENKRTWGISAAIQDTQLDILFPIWAGERAIISPGIGIINIGGSGTDIRFGLLSRIFLNADETIKPFLGVRAGVLLALPEENDGLTDFVFGLLGGGEYFFSTNFSIGIEGQLNLTISDKSSGRFGNPGGTNFNTASVIYATVYF